MLGMRTYEEIRYDPVSFDAAIASLLPKLPRLASGILSDWIELDPNQPHGIFKGSVAGKMSHDFGPCDIASDECAFVIGLA